jgi:uncharacterized protein YbaP (TraB family)
MRQALRVLCVTALAMIPAWCRADAVSCPPAPQPPTLEAVQAAMRSAHDHGFLWRLSKDGRTSYLFGTIHLAKFEWAFPGPQVMAAVRASDTVALELDLFDPDLRARLAEATAAMPRTALPPSLTERLRRQAEAECVAYADLSGEAPELQVVTLTLMASRSGGLDAQYATDIILAGLGHGAGKTVVSLETPESQLRVLQMRDADETRDFVASGLDDLATGHASAIVERLARDWAGADHDDLAHYEQWCDCLRTETERALMKRTLDDRNPVLAGRIDELHQSGKRVFAAVGSLHMFGPGGLPALMAQRGYRVERIDLAAR